MAPNPYQDNEHIKFTRQEGFLIASKNYSFLCFTKSEKSI